jgi:glutaredoxin
MHRLHIVFELYSLCSCDRSARVGPAMLGIGISVHQHTLRSVNRFPRSVPSATSSTMETSVTMTASVGVVTTIGCPYCKKAKAALRDKGVEYQEAELGRARDVLAKVKETTGKGTVPQVCSM